MGYDGKFLDGALWRIYSDPEFSKVFIIVGGVEDTILISAPADNREQAVDIAKELESYMILE